MLIREVFEHATNNKDIDLQALIMFLVFEKEVLTMDDDIKELDLYLLPKHKERMNQELIAYKKKMNMNYDPFVFEIKDGHETHYVLAYTEKQARFIASEKLLMVNEIKTCDLDQLMTLNGRNTTFRTLIKGKVPSVLGGH